MHSISQTKPLKPSGSSPTLPISSQDDAARSGISVRQIPPKLSTDSVHPSWRASENLLNRILPNRCQSMRQSGSAQVLNFEQRAMLSQKMADQLICRLTQKIDAFNIRWPETLQRQPIAVSCQLHDALMDPHTQQARAFNGLIEHLSDQIKTEIEAFSSYNYDDAAHLTLLRTVLDRLKYYESTPNTPTIKGVFAHDYGEILRTALLSASNKLALPMESWEFAIKAPVTDAMRQNPWPVIEKFSNFTPEAQTRVHHAMMHFYLASNSFTHASAQQLNLDTQSPGIKAGLAADMVALKGGYGAGKTSLITKMGDAAYNAAIGSDRIKQFLRKPFESIPQTVFHRHASTIAWELINALCDARGQKAIFDSSLSAVSDVQHFLAKCDQAGKTLSIQDIARTDIARILAVLARSVIGEDPRIPFANLVRSAARDQTTRPKCLNEILHHKRNEHVALSHNYVLHASDDLGTDTQELFVLSPGCINLLVSGKVISERLHQFGIEYQAAASEQDITTWPAGPHQAQGSFRARNDLMPSQDLHRKLQNPVRELLKTINPQESAKRKTLFSGRTLPLTSLPTKATPKALYHALDATIQHSISLENFMRACQRLETQNPLTKTHAQESPAIAKSITTTRFEQIYNTFLTKTMAGHPVSFLDLPLDFALEVNAALTKMPTHWAT